MNLFVKVTLGLALLSGCNASYEEKAKLESTNVDADAAAPAGLLGGAVGPGSLSSPLREKQEARVNEKIKKTADINITVKDYRGSRAKIEGLVKSAGGFIASENEQNSTYDITNNLVIRVPNERFDILVNQVSDVASHVNSRNISSENVTAQYVDIVSRLKTKKEVENRYLEILHKANKISEILEVEEKLRVIREEIEAKEGELKYLNDQVAMSTINLSMRQDFEYRPVDEPGFFGRIGHAFGNGWTGFLTFIVGFVNAWPVWLVLGLIAWVVVRFIKRMKRK
jgi:hypothetical protein